MSSKRYYVDKNNADGQGIKTTQCGGGSKTVGKAYRLKAEMRAIDAKRHGSNWYSVREGRK
jgi:hypothetical protein